MRSWQQAKLPRLGAHTTQEILKMRISRVALLGAAALWGCAEVSAYKPFHHSPSISLGIGHEQATSHAALLLEVKERNLRAWANYAEIHQLPPLWVVCAEHDSGKAALVKDLWPNLRAFVVEEDVSWATVFRRFRVEVCMNARAFFHPWVISQTAHKTFVVRVHVACM